MSETTTWQRLRTYVSECARILYWAYFKPYTFQRWLEGIHPRLQMDSNPFDLREEWDEHPRLRRYAWQVWWLSAVTPLIAALLIGLVWTLFSPVPFEWVGSARFLIGWWVGLWLARSSGAGRWKRWASRFLNAVFVVMLIAGGLSQFAPGIVEGLVGLLPRALVQRLFDVLPTLASWWPLAVGVALGVAGGVALGVAGGVAFGVAGGVAVGVAVGVAFGVAVGVTCIAGVLRVYFWLPELLWMAWLKLQSRGGADRLLPYLPPYYDQLIVLPLPFLSSIIVEAYRENRAAAQQTIDYLITSTNQQQAAREAIVGIALETLKQKESPQAIAAVADELAWIPSPPPEVLGKALPQLIEVSQGVRAALEATSPYRQMELLRQPIATLERLRRSLALSDDMGPATTFGAIADRWQAVLENELTVLEERAAASAEIPQEYIAGSTLDPRIAGTRFRGREELFREIEQLALSSTPPVLLLYGQRRTGKTSTLMHLPERAVPDLVPLLVPVQGLATTGSLEGLARGLADQIIESARRARNLTLPHPDAEALRRDPIAALQRWMRQMERVVEGRTLLLCLDEFERLDEIVQATGSRAPLNLLRYLMEHRLQWQLLFSGAHTPEELADYWSDYLINTRTLHIGYLDERDARGLIRHPTEDFPDIYLPETVDLIVELTRCQPFLVQLVCYELVEHLNAEERWEATPDDVEAVVPVVFERGGQYFGWLWDTASPEEREVLHTLACGEQPVEASPTVLRSLVRREILERENATYRFQVPLIRRYVATVVGEV